MDVTIVGYPCYNTPYAALCTVSNLVTKNS